MPDDSTTTPPQKTNIITQAVTMYVDATKGGSGHPEQRTHHRFVPTGLLKLFGRLPVEEAFAGPGAQNPAICDRA